MFHGLDRIFGLLWVGATKQVGIAVGVVIAVELIVGFGLSQR